MKTTTNGIFTQQIINKKGNFEYFLFFNIVVCVDESAMSFQHQKSAAVSTSENLLNLLQRNDDLSHLMFAAPETELISTL